MLDKNFVAKILMKSCEIGGDFAEVFYEKSKRQGIFLTKAQVRSISSEFCSGIGIRIFKDDFFVYLSTNNCSEQNIFSLLDKIKATLDENKLRQNINFSEQLPESICKNSFCAFASSKNDKIDFLRRSSLAITAKSNKIALVDASAVEKSRNILIVNSEGLWCEDKQLYNYFLVKPFAEDGNNRFDGYFLRGAQKSADFYLNTNYEQDFENLVETSVDMLRAEPCPAGKMPVVIAADRGAVLFHEAIGHSLEATHVAKYNSLFSGRKGQKIAHENVTLVDDATLVDSWGSFNVDDEGNAPQRNLLIENGVLKNYLIDRFHAKLMGEKPNGCSRRHDYTFAPTSRMSNTLLLAGKNTPEEIIASVKNGVYVADFTGGSVNPATSTFNFSAKRAYKIENGKITKPLKGVKLIGKSEDILQKIVMVGTDFKLAKGASVCGSVSGRIPVSHGMPTVKISEITVGGQK